MLRLIGFIFTGLFVLFTSTVTIFTVVQWAKGGDEHACSLCIEYCQYSEDREICTKECIPSAECRMISAYEESEVDLDFGDETEESLYETQAEYYL